MTRSAKGLEDEFLEALGFYQHRPVEFVEDVIGAEPDDWQKHVLRALDAHDKVAVRSGTGVGKDALAAWSILWFLTTRSFAKVPCTAPNASLLNEVLWSEIHKWMRISDGLGALFTWNATTIRHRIFPEEWFAVARTTSTKVGQMGDRQAEGLAGFHADHLLFVIDEASGVDDEHFDAAEGTLTGTDNKILVIANPLRVEGRFFDIFNKASIRQHWHTTQVSALPREGVKWVAQRGEAHRKKALELIDSYTEQSVIVQARVYGEFPVAGASNAVFSYNEIHEAMSRTCDVSELDEVQIGVDCARFGDDETVFMVRRGRKVRSEVMAMSSAVEIAGRVMELSELEADLTRPEFDHRPLIVIDDAGAGGGASVLDIVWSQGYTNVIGVSFGDRPKDPDHYNNLAAEMWIRELKDAMEWLCLPYDERLLHQLISRAYMFTGAGAQRALQRKDDMKRRGLGSPDRADALCLSITTPAVPGII